MSSIKLKNIFVCENVIVSFNGQLSLINLVSEITSTAFPALHPRSTILVSVSGESGSYDEKVEIINLTDDKIIATVSGKIEIKDAGGNNFIASFINIVFPQEGKYWIKVVVDGITLTNKDEHFFNVKKVA